MPRFLLLMVVAVASAGACSNSTPSPSVSAPTAAAIPSPSAPASAPATVGPSSVPPTAVVPASVAPSASTSGVADLSSQLPSSVGGHVLRVAQFSGAQLEAGGAVNQQMKDLVASLGRKLTDLTMAIATDPTSRTDLNITAFRVRDVPVEKFLTGYLPLLAQAWGDGAISQGTRAGRPVHIVVPQPGKPAQVLVGHGDVLFVVISADDALADEAIAQLP